MALLNHPGQATGTVFGSSITGITAVQLASAGYDPTPGRIDVWKADFSVTAGGFRVIDFATVTSRFLVYPTLSGLPAAEPRALPVEGGARIEVIPAPSSLAALGLAGLAAVRCRRPHIGAGRGGKET